MTAFDPGRARGTVYYRVTVDPDGWPVSAAVRGHPHLSKVQTPVQRDFRGQKPVWRPKPARGRVGPP
jgi:hypothetical protein